MSSESKSRAPRLLLKLLPSSLSARLLLIMFGSILVAQLVSGLVYLQDRREIGSRYYAFSWSERLRDIATLLEQTDPGQRPQALERLQDENGVGAVQESSRRRDLHDGDREFMRLLQERFGALPHRGYQISIAPARMDDRADVILGSFNNLPAVGLPAYVDATLRFDRGAPVTLRLQLVERAIGVPNHFYVYPLALVGALFLGSLLLARGITGPLSRLVTAADALGRGLPHEPLPESGARELKRAARAFNSMRDRLRRYLDSRTRVLAAMSHDLRTPITRLRLRAESLSPPQLRHQFVRDLESMQMMVQGALDMLRGLESTEPVQPVNLAALLEALRDDYESLGLPIEIEGRIERPLACRPQALRRLLTNLLDNARQYAHQVGVRVEEADNEVVLHIADDGPGIPEAELERVMEPYYRVEASRDRATGGTGLGLSIARDIAQGHGGQLALRNRREGGLEATIHIPRQSLKR
jgi:signal transduction histidine kinase